MNTLGDSHEEALHEIWLIPQKGENLICTIKEENSFGGLVLRSSTHSCKFVLKVFGNCPPGGKSCGLMLQCFNIVIN